MPRTVAAALLAVALAGAAAAAAPSAAASGSVPKVSAVAATSGSTAGGTRVTVTGSRFARGVVVYFGTARGSSVRLVSSSKLQVTTPAHAAGAVDVRVHTKAGTSARHVSDRFTYVSPPSVGSVSPHLGVGAAGGTRVTVTGHGFTGVTAVRFGTAAATAVKVLSSTTLQVTTPAHPSGTYDVQVVNRYGPSRTTAADRISIATSFAATEVVGLDQTLAVSAYGLRPGTMAAVALDDDAISLGSVKVSASGTALLGFVVSEQVSDGAHALRLTGTDGTGGPAVFDSALLVDSTPPAVDDVQVTGDAHAGGTITVTAHVTDDGGVQSIGLEVDGLGGDRVCAHAPTLASGDASDGIWTMDCALPPRAPAGDYTVVAWGSDVVDNPFVSDGWTFTVS